MALRSLSLQSKKSRRTEIKRLRHEVLPNRGKPLPDRGAGPAGTPAAGDAAFSGRWPPPGRPGGY